MYLFIFVSTDSAQHQTLYLYPKWAWPGLAVGMHSSVSVALEVSLWQRRTLSHITLETFLHLSRTIHSFCVFPPAVFSNQFLFVFHNLDTRSRSTSEHDDANVNSKGRCFQRFRSWLLTHVYMKREKKTPARLLFSFSSVRVSLWNTPWVLFWITCSRWGLCCCTHRHAHTMPLLAAPHRVPKKHAG